MVHRLILASWAAKLDPSLKKTIEGSLSDEEIKSRNLQGYNCYFFPNGPSDYENKKSDGYVSGTDIDLFLYCFVDLDMKDYQSDNPDRRHDYPTKESFVQALKSFKLPPHSIVDSGGGIHAYWNIADLDAMSFLRLQRRLARFFRSDPEVSKIAQLMRLPDTFNVKIEKNPRLCSVIDANDGTTTCEAMDQALPKISMEDEQYCKDHFNSTYSINELKLNYSDELPQKFHLLLKDNPEVSRLFFGPVSDRSIADYRLAHLLLAQNLSKEEAMSVLVNTAKAVERRGKHRHGYALGIVEKVWEETTAASPSILSRNVKDILRQSVNAPKGLRFPCNPVVDATTNGYRLMEVLGLIAGPGSGKTTIGLNFFLWFAERNPDFIHLFVTLEQPEQEIAHRWATITKGNDLLDGIVHVLGNYNEDGTYRNLSLSNVQEHIHKLEAHTGKKVGCVVIDHVGVLKKPDLKDGKGIISVFEQLKSFAVNTNTFVVVQSQSSREKASIGDIELDLDAAYGGAQFEWYCDYIMTTWQPLKRVYDIAPHMTVNAFKYCKIRNRNIIKDKIKCDQVYALMFDPSTERLRQMSKEEMVEFEFFSGQATKLRKRDKKSEPSLVKIISWVEPTTKEKSDD